MSWVAPLLRAVLGPESPVRLALAGPELRDPGPGSNSLRPSRSFRSRTGVGAPGTERYMFAKEERETWQRPSEAGEQHVTDVLWYRLPGPNPESAAHGLCALGPAAGPLCAWGVLLGQ